MNQLSELAKNMTVRSAEVNIGNGVSGVIVKERVATDIAQVSLAYAATTGSANVGA